MPTPAKIVFALIFLFFGGAIYSLRIPFIFYNQLYLTFIIAYSILGLFFVNSVIYENFLDRNVMGKWKKKKWPVYLSFFLSPLFISFYITQSTSLVADLVSSHFEIREFKVVKARQMGKYARDIYELTVVDYRGDEYYFYIKPADFSNLNIPLNGSITVQGRSSMFGLVIDRINNVPRS